MATLPQHWNQDEETDSLFADENAHLPGASVDALVAQGRIAEAKAELESLIASGPNPGKGKTLTCVEEEEQYLNGLMVVVRKRVGPAA